MTGDREWLREAVELSRRCPPAPAAYSVGAVVVGPDGRRLADGWSRRSDPAEHAEEAALAALPAGADLAGATVYSSLEPCSMRRSRPRTCTELILAAGVGRVVLALREPPLLADCHGVELLRAGGVAVVELPELAGAVRAVNAHLLGDDGGMTFDLDRFVAAQDAAGTYEGALAELRAGRKAGHWMWFVFPQVEGLGRSGTAQRYGVRGLAEARAYLAHPVLGPRLVAAARALTGLPGRDPVAVLGSVDALKLRSSMTLFGRADPGEPVFAEVLAQFYGGAEDDATLARIRDRPDPS